MLFHSFEMGDFRIHSSYVIIDSIFLIPTLILFSVSIILTIASSGGYTDIWRRDLDTSNIFLDNFRIVNIRLDKDCLKYARQYKMTYKNDKGKPAYLDIMLHKLLRQLLACQGYGVDCIVDRYLAILMV